jgi:hypothetical protein
LPVHPADHLVDRVVQRGKRLFVGGQDFDVLRALAVP